MTASWVIDALPEEALQVARQAAAQRLLQASLGTTERTQPDESGLRFMAEALELALLDLLQGAETLASTKGALASEGDRLRIATDLFHVLRALEPSGSHLDVARGYLRTGCVGVLADRGADVARLLRGLTVIDELPLQSLSWGERTAAAVLDVWLRMLRKDGWSDLTTVQERVVALRANQREFEAKYLERQGPETARQAAWELVLFYHLAKGAEILARYTTQGESDAGFDVREQLQGQFDRALIACGRAELVEWDAITRLLYHTSLQLVDNSIWTSTRAINPRVTEFVEKLVSRERAKPLFDLLPPQRRALREAGLRGGARAIVVNLPTSSGKTFIAQFRILQALNQFEREQGWVAYLAPTRALVNQVCARLRRDFALLEIQVERVSPALEIDSLEAGLLTDSSRDTQFQVLVTTPEKLDLMIRGGWEAKIGRPLTLVVVDEAHNLGTGDRGIKLELLLATINRECRNAQFLLLTPFIQNAGEVAAWLSPESNSIVELSVDWSPNDRVVGLAKPRQVPDARAFSIQLETLHTTHETLSVDDDLPICVGRPLDLTWNRVRRSNTDLAAATAQCLKSRGSVIVLCSRPDWAFSLAKRFQRPENYVALGADARLVQTYLQQEFGEDFELAGLLEYGVGVHHAGLSDEAKALMEWLFENGHLSVLAATTTIAQGVNFPVAAVVLAQHQFYDGARTAPMPAADFWNIAGRAGRADQAAAGIVALAASDPEKEAQLRDFVSTQVSTLNSTLLAMVASALQAGEKLELHSLFYRPEWSAFLQYLAHTYRQIGDPDRFAQQIDRILRGTFGFQRLRDTNREVAQLLVDSAQAYGTRLVGKPLSLVDSTGFSWETVSITLRRLSEERVREDVWEPSLFSGNSRALRSMMGILLEVPELRENLAAATGGRGADGDLLARIVSDWVNGVTLPDLAAKYFTITRTGEHLSKTDALTECCRNVFGKLSQTASWGLAALQAMTLGERFDRMPEATQQTIRNLPSRVFYGVASDDAISLRLLGVPRQAAQPLARSLHAEGTLPVSQRPLLEVRRDLASLGAKPWKDAMGNAGDVYWQVWSILEAVR